MRRAGSNEEGEHLLQVYSSFWFVAIHTLFFVDPDLGNAQPNFAPPEPFRTEDQEVNIIPRRTYTRDEVLGWVARVRAKARVTLAALTEEEAERPAGRGNRPFAELLMRCLVHTREHTAQLSMFLGQHRAP